jgi:hypothetical protein
MDHTEITEWLEDLEKTIGTVEEKWDALAARLAWQQKRLDESPKGTVDKCLLCGHEHERNPTGVIASGSFVRSNFGQFCLGKHGRSWGA